MKYKFRNNITKPDKKNLKYHHKIFHENQSK